MEQEVWINKDGSGSTEVRYDLGEMMNSMGSIMNELENQDSLDFSESKESKSLIPIDGLLGSDNSDWGENMDTIIRAYDIISDSTKNKINNSELLKKSFIIIKTNKSERAAVFGFRMMYDDQEELKKMLELTEEVKSDRSDMSVGLDLDGMTDIGYDYDVDLERGILKIPAQDLTKDLEEEGMKYNDNDPEEIMMMKMLFGDSRVSITYHLPGKIEFSSNLKAQIDGKSITFSYSYMDLLKMKEIPSMVVKFIP
jgi:hypothetical protein